MKKALMTGITGQDGSYLAGFLLDRGYEVFGLIRRSSTFNTWPHRPPLQRPPRKPETQTHLRRSDRSRPILIQKHQLGENILLLVSEVQLV